MNSSTAQTRNDSSDHRGLLAAVRRIGWLETCLLLSMLCLAIQLLPGVIRGWLERPRAGRQTAATATIGSEDKQQADICYLIYLPQEYSSAASWPLLLFLHGSGERGNDVQLVARHGPPAMLAQGKQLPMIVVSPQCKADTNWDADVLQSLLNQLEKQWNVDPHRIYVCGYSMGGDGVWKLLSRAPDRFAAAVAISSRASVDLASRLIAIPIWEIHGAKDTVIPAEGSRRMIAAIQSQGGDARQTIYEDQGHDICDDVFARENLIDWLLSQRRADK